MKISSYMHVLLCCLPLALGAEESLKKVSLEVAVLSPECQELEQLRASIPGVDAPTTVSYDAWCESSSSSLHKLIDLIMSKQLKQDLFWSISIGDNEETTKRLETIGKSYMDLLNSIGTNQERSYDEEITSLFSPNCKKIVNGTLKFEGAEHFVPQLLNEGASVGSWTIEPLETIPGRDGRTVVIRFRIPTERGGIWNSLVILRCNDQFQIAEVNGTSALCEDIR